MAIEVKFRGDGGPDSSEGKERRHPLRDQNWDMAPCQARVLKEVRKPVLSSLADDKPFDIKFGQQPLSDKGDPQAFRLFVIGEACRQVGAEVQRKMDSVYLGAIQPRDDSQS